MFSKYKIITLVSAVGFFALLALGYTILSLVVFLGFVAICGSQLLLDGEYLGVKLLIPSAFILTAITFIITSDQRPFYGAALIVFTASVGARLMNSSYPWTRAYMSVLSFATVLALPFDELNVPLIDLGCSPAVMHIMPFVSFLSVATFYIYTNRKIFSNNQRLDASEQQARYMQHILRLVSHNIRTPLANVVLLAETAKFMYQDQSLAALLDRITGSVQHSSEFLNRLLRVLNESELADEYSSLQVVEHFEKRNPTLNIKVNSGNKVTYSQMEFISLILALEVFVDNAFRHGQEPVVLEMGDKKIHVRDHGLGMTPSELDRFGVKSENQTSTIHGVGMHFAIQMLRQLSIGVSACNLPTGFQVSLNKL